MLHKQEAPGLVIPAASKAVRFQGSNSFDNSLRDLQTQHIRDRWEHISWPVAKVIAELAFKGGYNE